MTLDRRSFLMLTGTAAAGAALAKEETMPETKAPADPWTYLAGLAEELRKTWPDNRVLNLVCHGHSVPAGYFRTPVVDTFNAYPHLLHVELKKRFPFAVINVIVTAVGGEESDRGAARFQRDVLCHRPDLITLDYGLNDRRIGLARARAAWEAMIVAAGRGKIPMLLLTPSSDLTQRPDAAEKERLPLREHAAQIRALAAEHRTGLVDSLAAFERRVSEGTPLEELLSQSNHPNRAGHDLIARELLKWFPEA